MKKINLVVLVCLFFHCMQFHASFDCKNKDTSIMKIRHTSRLDYNSDVSDDVDEAHSYNFATMYDYLQQGFSALQNNAQSMTFFDFLQCETGCAVDTNKKLDKVIVQKAEAFIAQGIKDRFWQKLMDDVLSYKDACKMAWIPSLIPSPFLMSSRHQIIAYVIAHRNNFTKSEFLKCIYNKNRDGQTVFDMAMHDYDKHHEFIDMVAQVEPNIYVSGHNYYIWVKDKPLPLLVWAIKEKKCRLYTQLIGHEKIDFNLQDDYNSTALHFAAIKGDLNAVQLLFQYGLNKLDLNIKNRFGYTALELASTDEVKELFARI